MIDVIGTIYTAGTYDEEGNVITPPEPIPGYHVNSLEQIKDCNEYLIIPEHPRRIFWDNTNTFYYCFPDEQTWNQYDPRPKEVEK